MSEELPEGWAMAPLADLVDGLQYGFTASASAGTSEPKFLRITDIREDGVDWATVPGCAATPSEVAKYQLRNGDLVFARSGSIEKAWRVANVPPRAVFASYLIRATPRSEPLSVWLEQFVRSPGHLVQIGAAAAGTGMQNVNATKLGAVRIPVPPLNEQRRIVAKLEALQARSRRAREALDAVPPLLEKLRQSILAAAFRGDLTKDWRAKNKDVEPATMLLERIRKERRAKWEEAELAKMKAKGKAPTDDKWKAKYKEPEPVNITGLPELPEGWCWASVESLTDADRGVPYGIVLTGNPVDAGVPTVRCGDIKNFSIDIAALKRVAPTVAAEFSRTRLEGGEVLIAIRGTVGATAVATVEMSGMNISREVAMIPLLRGLDPTYLMYCLAGPEAEGRVMKHVKGVAQAGINLSDLRTLPVPVPPMPEQDEVLAALERKLAACLSLERVGRNSAERLATLDRSVLAKAFRGDLVPQDPNDEPAETLVTRAVGAKGTAASGEDAAGHPSRRGRRKGLATSKTESDAEV